MNNLKNRAFYHKNQDKPSTLFRTSHRRFAITAITCAITKNFSATYCKPTIYCFSDSSDSKNRENFFLRVLCERGTDLV